MKVEVVVIVDLALPTSINMASRRCITNRAHINSSNLSTINNKCKINNFKINNIK